MGLDGLGFGCSGWLWYLAFRGSTRKQPPHSLVSSNKTSYLGREKDDYDSSGHKKKVYSLWIRPFQEGYLLLARYHRRYFGINRIPGLAQTPRFGAVDHILENLLISHFSFSLNSLLFGRIVPHRGYSNACFITPNRHLINFIYNWQDLIFRFELGLDTPLWYSSWDTFLCYRFL